MELPSKNLEQIPFNTRSRIEEHFLINMDKSTHEEHLPQPLQPKNKKFKIALTFLTSYNGNFKVTDKNNRFYSTKSISNDDGSFQIIIPEVVYEIESLNIEIERIIIEKELYTEAIYPFAIKQNFSSL